MTLLKLVAEAESKNCWVEEEKISRPPCHRLFTKSGTTKDGNGVVKWFANPGHPQAKPTLIFLISWNQDGTITSFDRGQLQIGPSLKKLFKIAGLHVPKALVMSQKLHPKNRKKWLNSLNPANGPGLPPTARRMNKKSRVTPPFEKGRKS